MAAGCGDDNGDGGDATASGGGGETAAGARTPDAEGSPAATARLVLLTAEKAKKDADCKEIRPIITRSPYKFVCPPLQGVPPIKGFEVRKSETYGTGAVVDYTTKKTRKGASMTLFVDPTREWGISRFGIVTDASVGTSDEGNRAASRRAVDKYLKAVRERDCETYNTMALTTGGPLRTVCKEEFGQTKPLGRALAASGSVNPEYLGGNGSFGFYGVETSKPKPRYWTISTAKTVEGAVQPFIVLDSTEGPVAK